MDILYWTYYNGPTVMHLLQWTYLMDSLQWTSCNGHTVMHLLQWNYCNRLTIMDIM